MLVCYVKLNVATSQSYSSFVHSVKHEILGGYGVRCSIDGCYVCSSDLLEAMGYDFVTLALLIYFFSKNLFFSKI